MIWRPKPGQKVRIHYRKAVKALFIYHGATGIVSRVATGPGPINVLVRVADIEVVVPRGNLYAV